MKRKPRKLDKSLRALRRVVDCRRGATAIEYGLILALVFLAMIGAVQLVGTKTIDMWGNVSSKVNNAS